MCMALGSLNIVVRSLNMIPGFGKSYTSRIFDLMYSIVYTFKYLYIRKLLMFHVEQSPTHKQQQYVYVAW